MTVMFDTLKFARTLREGGRFTPEQAEGLSDAIADAMAGEIVGRVDLKATEAALHDEIVAVRTELKTEIATLRAELKGDIADLRAELKGDIADLRAELKGDIADLRSELRGSIAAVRLELHDGLASVRTDMKGLEAKIEAARSDTIKWAVGIIGFQSVTIIGAAVVLSRYLAR